MLLLQQDNAWPYTSKRTQAFPPYSPDMNIIENLWAHLKLELHHRYPDRKTLHGGPETVKRVLK